MSIGRFLREHIQAPIMAHLLSQTRLEKKRQRIEKQRLWQKKPHEVLFFHDPSDPHSHLLASVMPKFEARYDVKLTQLHISPPTRAAAPEKEMRQQYHAKDSLILAAKAGINFNLAACDTSPARLDTSKADARLAQLGHYQGAMLYYGGEWYWGLDRLHYLEARLNSLGLSTQKPNTAEDYIFSPPEILLEKPSAQVPIGTKIDFYLSFRSPYTAIVAPRIKALADAYGAQLNLRFVLPMVMRGLPVPPSKKWYILNDVAREAHRQGQEFGRIFDPVGRPVEKGYALLPYARAKGRGYDYIDAFLKLVWSQGVNAGSRNGQRKIIETAGLDWAEACQYLDNEDWRSEAEANRQEMMALGSWGVPSFKIGETMCWGQDRLWQVEDELKKLVSTS